MTVDCEQVYAACAQLPDKRAQWEQQKLRAVEAWHLELLGEHSAVKLSVLHADGAVAHYCSQCARIHSIEPLPL